MRGAVAMAAMTIKKYVFSRATSKGIPVSGTFELTSRCNLDCKMCYIHAAQCDRMAMERELTADQWLDLARQAVDAGMIYLLLTGGEPMLRPDFVQIYTGLAKMGIIVSVNTNATILTPRILEAFQQYPPERVNVTLYGASAGTYGALCGNADGYELAMRHIKALKQAGVNVNINTTFTRLNISDMERLVSFSKEIDAPVGMAAYLFPPVRGGCGVDSVFLDPEDLGRAAAKFDWMTLAPDVLQARAEMIRTTLDEPRTAPAKESRAAACTAGRGSFWITWDGKMLPCGMLLSGADVIGQDLVTAWQQTKENIKQYLLPVECLSCRYQSVCPSCVAISADEEGNGVLQEPMCRRTEVYAEELLRYAQL